MSLSLPVYAIYGLVGFFEWALALSRTISTIRNYPIIVAGTVFIESLVGLLVFKRFIEQDDWAIAVIYSMGSAIGSLLPMWIVNRRDKRLNNGKAVDSGGSKEGTIGCARGFVCQNSGAVAFQDSKGVLQVFKTGVEGDKA